MILRRRFIAAVCLIVAMALAAYASFFWAHARNPAFIARVGHRLPVLPVVDASGSEVDAAQVSLGHKCVIAFYSASCHACQVVLPQLRPFPPMVHLILINVEETQSADPDWQFQTALRFRDINRVLSRSFPMAGTPTILFVDEFGVLRDGMVGEQARDLVQRKLWEFADSRQ